MNAERTDAAHASRPASPGRGVLSAVLLLIALAASCTCAESAAAAPTGSVSAQASTQELGYGAALTVTGSVGAAGAVALVLEVDPYPYAGFTPMAETSSAPDGSYAFSGVKLDRDSRLRVSLQAGGAPPSGPIAVEVEPSVAINAASLGAGRARLSIRLGHTVHAGAPAPVDASWFAAPRGTHAFRLLAVTRTRELAAGLTYASATIDPPARRFVYRVCLRPSWGRAMGRSRGEPSCPGPAGGLVFAGEGRGIPLTPFPSAGAIAAASAFLAARAGRTALAVVDSSGRLSGLHLREHFETASVIKVMMLVTFLQMRSAQGRQLSSADRALLYPMIHISDNNAASAVYSIVGAGAVSRVAREAGMRDYAPGIGWWAFAQTSAADQARFFFMLERLIPARFYPYARGLLDGIEPSQSWGVPPVARPRWQVFFKTGALPSQGLFNEVARLERPGTTFTIAVFTDGDPSMSYGEQTIEGVASVLLRGAP
jgi:hypothetical protein